MLAPRRRRQAKSMIARVPAALSPIGSSSQNRKRKLSKMISLDADDDDDDDDDEMAMAITMTEMLDADG